MKRRKWVLVLMMVLLPIASIACTPEAEEYEEVGVDEEIETDVADSGLEEEPVETVGVDGYGYDWDWGTYDTWDADADAELTEAEFGEGFGGVYDTWDGDADGALGWDEFETTTYDWWDVDDDDRIGEDEWNTVTTAWTVDGYEWGAYGDYDTDGDGYLGTTEYGEFFNEEAWNGVWDLDDDGVVGRDEAADTFFDLFDGDDDNLVDGEEWSTWTT